MKNALILIILLSNFNVRAQNQIIYSQFVNEVKGFIDTAKTISGNHGVNNVYLVNIFRSENDSACLLFSISYLINRSDAYYIHMKYYMIINSDIVLINAENITNLNRITEKKIDATLNERIQKKLGDDNVVYVTGGVCGSIVHITNTVVKRKFYYDIMDMPVQFSKLEFPPGGTIRLLPDYKSTDTSYYEFNLMGK